MSSEFTGEVILRPSFRASTRDQPRPVRLRRHAVADPPGLARGDGADVRRGAAAPAGRDRGRSLRELVLDDIMRLNGKQTIYQMIQLAERIRERGGEPEEPLWYKHEYLRRLDRRIAARIDGAPQAGSITARRAARPRRAGRCSKHLRGRGLPLYLASGTDESVREARGRAARPHPLLRRATSTGPHDDYKHVLQEDGHRPHPPRERRSPAGNCSPSATATSRSRTPSRSAAWPWPSPATRPHNGSGRMDAVEARPPLGRRRRRRHPRLPRRRPSVEPDPGTMNTTPLDLNRLRVRPLEERASLTRVERDPARTRRGSAAAARSPPSADRSTASRGFARPGD